MHFGSLWIILAVVCLPLDLWLVLYLAVTVWLFAATLIAIIIGFTIHHHAVEKRNRVIRAHNAKVAHMLELDFAHDDHIRRLAAQAEPRRLRKI